MFASLFKRVQLTVDKAVTAALEYAVAGVLFLIAFCFLTASLAVKLIRHFGPEIGLLIIAAIFLVAAVILTLILSRKGGLAQAVEPERPAEPEAPVPAVANHTVSDSIERELVSAAIRAGAPVAMPMIARLVPMAFPVLLRVVAKNLPVIAALGAVTFVIVRNQAAQQAADQAAVLDR